MTEFPLVSIQVVVYNGEQFIRHCLDHVTRLTYPNLEIIIFDNASTDATADIVAREYPQFRLIRHDKNLGLWPGQEHLLKLSAGEYVVALCVDVMLDSDFVTRGLAVLQSDERIGAVQGKIFQYNIAELAAQGSTALGRGLLDTCGFTLTRARRVVNVGHGLSDDGSYSQTVDIFGVEGAVPFYRRSVLIQCAVDGRLWDPEYFWYGDDLDMAWRMHLFGFRQVFVPDAVAWHDRATTKGTATVPVFGQLQRLSQRRAVPLFKRRLDWSNVRFTIIKNDYIINILRSFPRILIREISIFMYTLAFEPGALREAGRFIRLAPRMISRRFMIMNRAVAPAAEVHGWFL